MAFPDRHWARAWRKFVQENFWLDSLQLGQLLLLLLSLLTLLVGACCLCLWPFPSAIFTHFYNIFPF
jgi:hypothetical protein